MFTAVLIIWSAVLLVGTVCVSTFLHVRKDNIYFEKSRLSVKIDELEKKEESLLARESLIKEREATLELTKCEMSEISVGISYPEGKKMRRSYRSAARKALAQKLGYKIMAKYHADIKEYTDPETKTRLFVFDCLASSWK